MSRHEDANELAESNRHLSAIYFHGYAVEMCLTAAVFRALDWKANDPIDRDTRHRRMVQARKQDDIDGDKVMSSDPHPLVGWARYLRWLRSTSDASPKGDVDRLEEAIRQAATVYRHWRPELRYKLRDVENRQLVEVRRATGWFIQQIGSL